MLLQLWEVGSRLTIRYKKQRFEACSLLPSFKEVLASSIPSSLSFYRFYRGSIFSTPQVSQWKYLSVRIIDSRLSLTNGNSKSEFLLQPVSWVSRSYSARRRLLSICYSCFFKWSRYNSLPRVLDCSVKFKEHASILPVRLVVGLMLVMAVSFVFSEPSWALTEENLLFLEAWRAIDRAYIDKSFNGQNWFKYRENALQNEPMNNREETYMAIRKMFATLDDPFTRFLEPERFKSLRSGSQGALTGVGFSIGLTKADGAPFRLVVISASPGGPASKSGISSGDIILTIDDTSTESMGYMMQLNACSGAPEGSSVVLTIRSGSEVKNIALTREKVSLNPVKSRVCKVTASGNDSPSIGYIKLTSFNQKASGAITEAVNTLRSDNVNAFVLDLRDNSGGLFPEGIEIAKIWLDKGVIVYICDSRGVRDILDTDGSDALATSEPLAVLVNKGTASASEILAGALKDNKRPMLFGEPTFGKGKIQSVFGLSDGSGLVVTVARYETPAHSDIDKVGIIPDHPLPASFPKDEDAFCNCLQDPASSCHINGVELFSR